MYIIVAESSSSKKKNKPGMCTHSACVTIYFCSCIATCDNEVPPSKKKKEEQGIHSVCELLSTLNLLYIVANEDR